MAIVLENNYVGDGSTVLYSFTFEYIEPTDVEVSLNSVKTANWSFANATTVELATPPAAGVKIRIYRRTKVEQPKATFYPGSAIRSQDLNDNFEQILFVTQEADAISIRAEAAADSAESAAAAAEHAADQAEKASADALAIANNSSVVADNALNTANSAASVASTANQKADNATNVANAAASAVSSAVLFEIKANVSAIPASPADKEAIEVADSTGIETFSPLSGKPPGFVGSPGLSVNLIYSQSKSSWTWVKYFPNDPEDRYATKASVPWTRNGTNTVLANAGDRVGLGTSAPQFDCTISKQGTGVTSYLAIRAGEGGSASTSNAAILYYRIRGDGPGDVDANTTYSYNGAYLLQNSAQDGHTWSVSSGEAMRIDSSKRVGIGTQTPSDTLSVNGNINLASTSTGASYIWGTKAGNSFYIGVDNSTGSSFGSGTAYSPIIYTGAAAPITFSNSGTERARIDSSGRLLVGTSSAVAAAVELLQIAGVAGNTASPGGIALTRASVNNTDDIGFINFSNRSAGAAHAQIKAICDGTPGANDYPGALVFSTTADGASSPTERLRIAQNGAWGLAGANYGLSGQVLTSNGSASAPTWQPVGGFPAGTTMLFVQTSAPTGWTKSTAHNDKTLRVVSGAAGSGGTVEFSTAFTSRTISGSVDSTTLSVGQIPSHSHYYSTPQIQRNSADGGNACGNNVSGTTTGAEGGGGSHTHGFTGSSLDFSVQYVDVIIATKD